MPTQTSKTVLRLILFLVFFPFVIFIIFNLYKLQVLNHSELEILSGKQYFNRYTKENNRGSIILKYRDGKEFFAATNKTGYTIEINPQIIKNPEDTYNILSNYIELDLEDYLQKANKTNDNSEVLAERVDIEVAKEIMDLDLQGVIISKEKWRFYPGKNLAAQTIGFESYRGDKVEGMYGLERYYDNVLKAENDSVFRNFFIEVFSGLEKKVNGEEIGGSLISTIEPNIQTYSEEVIKNTQEKWSSKQAGVIVMNPNNGEIYAMALSPNFDINKFNEEENVSVYNNTSVESLFEVGSIIKPITVAIGLDTNTITPETTYEDKGSLTLDKKTIWNYDKKARGVVSMQEVLNQSLNTGAAFVALKVGNKTFSDYMKDLIGEKSGIDLPNEVSPLISNLDSGRDIEHATASYGHGIAITPVQTIRALATLSNGGHLVKPHVVKSIKYDLGVQKDLSFDDGKQVFKKETSEEITRMLIKVVDEALAGGTVALPNYSIAAKTGTAVLPDKVNGGYYDDKFFHTFFGYFPAYDPQFIILLYVMEPQGVLYASHTLTDPFMDIVKYLINYYEIEPDR